MERITLGKTPINILKKYGNAYNLNFTSSDKNSLSFPVSEVQTTLIRLEIEAKNRISFIRNIAQGKIESVQMINNGFEGFTDSGIL
jgi:hypothetical protein